MSLFKLREWWSTHIGNGDEEFSEHSFAIGNIDNDEINQQKICIGSYNGILHIYKPHTYGFQISDLMIEEDLERPILQLEVGCFLPHAPDIFSLAVLHPRHLCIYTIEGQGIKNNEASFYSLNKCYEHQLGIDGNHFTAYNMIIGKFGSKIHYKRNNNNNNNINDLICVQSMDGRLQVFEQDTHAFSRSFPNIILPGPLCYCDTMDAFITVDSMNHIQAFLYDVLAASQDEKIIKNKKNNNFIDDDNDDDNNNNNNNKNTNTISSFKKLHSEWSINLGETIKDIKIGRINKSLTPHQSEIIVLGEYTLFIIKEQGQITYQKRLDFTPLSLCLYSRAPPNASFHNLIISTTDNNLYIYQDSRMIWAAKTLRNIIQQNVSTFEVNGMIITLSSDGYLDINYLGTDPPSNSVTLQDGKDINYEAIDHEQRTLQQKIKTIQSSSGTEAVDRIILRAQVPNILDNESKEFIDNDIVNENQLIYADFMDNGLISITIRLYVTYTGNDTINDININLQVPNWIHCNEKQIKIKSIRGAALTPLFFPITFYATRKELPLSLNVIATAIFNSKSGKPRSTIFEFGLPLCLAGQIISPITNSSYKITLNTNQLPVEPIDLFPDMINQPNIDDQIRDKILNNSQILSFQYWVLDDNGAPYDVTIVVSNRAGKYRIQSDILPALWLITSELPKRIIDEYNNNINNNNNKFDLLIEYKDALPLEDFFEILDDHFKCRQDLLQINADLNDLSHQYRIIEKRLLHRFKDSNVTELSNLDRLLVETHNKILNNGNIASDLKFNLKKKSNYLSCTINLFLLLLKYRFQLDDENFNLLKQYIPSDVNDNSLMGWEETVDASITYLLRTKLAKNQKDSAIVPPKVDMPPDTSKLKKHISIICERLNRGTRLINNKKYSSSRYNDNSDDDDDDNNYDEEKN